MSELFSIYRSSAGSGKTRTLAKEYLKLALRYRADYFKHILAVTFTNKSTQEMKDRILAYLDDFANRRVNDLSEELRSELKLDESTFQLYAQEAQSEILHKYSQFSISTIDAFFQKVIRSFTREAGLVGDYRLELEQQPVMEEVINDLIDELGNNEELTKWVVEFANEQLENEKAWDIRSSLIDFSEEIFREEFKEIESDLAQTTSGKDFFTTLLASLRKRRYGFISTLTTQAREALTVMHQHQLGANDFKYGGGVYRWFQKVARITSVKDFDEEAKGKRASGDYLSSKNWPDKDTSHKVLITKLADEQLIPVMKEIVAFRDRTYSAALSAEVALSNFYSFGLITDISRKLKEYKDENGIMLLADAPRFLQGVIQDSDTPFIYEKVGSFYRNYLIDEFQDTSGLQWKNFLPLLTNGLDQGYPSMVVGDVKQAIYRWRGGDLNLLQQHVESQIGSNRVTSRELNHNFRSATALVSFNNNLFRSLAVVVATDTGKALSAHAYEDVAQLVSKKEEGFVSISFLRDEENIKWRDLALDKIPGYLEQLQDMGVPLSDIAILVRENREGQRIVAHLLQYKNSDKARKDCRYEVVSNESLRLDGAGAVNLIISALRYLLNTENDIARAQLAYEYTRLHEPERDLAEVFSVTNLVTFENNLPEAFTKKKGALKKMPLFELTETLIELFDLGKETGELAYLQTFQDFVLEFSSRERNDIGVFLEWWEEFKTKKSIQVSGEVDAVQILTIHKSKGLQFKYVLVPFCAWELDHGYGRNPNLWVRADEQPFTEAGYLPVKYSSALNDTLFAEAYHEERSRSYLDNLNLLYVAFTRAENGLIVMAPFRDRYKKSVGTLLREGLERDEELKQRWNEKAGTWDTGTWMAISSAKQKMLFTPVELHHYASTSWREQLVIRQTAKGYFDREENEAREKVKYGIHLHAVLSKVKYQSEMNDVLERLVFDGLVLELERPRIQELLNELMSNPVVAGWFSEAWTVRTEVPVILPGGGDNRMDRLMTNNKKAVIVDFKTGEPVKKDQHQVAEYMNILHSMGFTEVEGYLLYTKKGEVLSIPPGKAARTKKKDNTQLGLDF